MYYFSDNAIPLSKRVKAGDIIIREVSLKERRNTPDHHAMLAVKENPTSNTICVQHITFLNEDENSSPKIATLKKTDLYNGKFNIYRASNKKAVDIALTLASFAESLPLKMDAVYVDGLYKKSRDKKEKKEISVDNLINNNFFISPEKEIACHEFVITIFQLAYILAESNIESKEIVSLEILKEKLNAQDFSEVTLPKFLNFEAKLLYPDIWGSSLDTDIEVTHIGRVKYVAYKPYVAGKGFVASFSNSNKEEYKHNHKQSEGKNSCCFIS